jgi:alkanesulfonate monooxygenase SsuD/methylene tetrahydromethanopterin reductase-like flavin-dependent oxidoreductase (luciferase family)
MCRGRLCLGLGLGWMPYEFQAFGVDFGQRAARFTELVEAYRALSTQDVVNYPGKYYDLSDVRIIAHGPQRPMAPLWLGASSDAPIRRAARLADAWVMSAHIEVGTLRRQLRLYDQARSEAGLPGPRSRPIVRMLAIADDRETAVNRIRPTLEQWYRERGEWGWFIKNAQGTEAEKLGGGRWIVGDPDDCVAQIRELRDELGVTDVIFGMNWPGIDQASRLATISLLKNHVIPRLRADDAE